MKLFKKKYHINEKGKERIALTLWFLFTLTAMLVATKIYTDRVEKINNGEMTVQCRCGE